MLGSPCSELIALDFTEHMQRRRNRIGRAREDSHHCVTDRLDDSARMLLDDATEQCKVLADQSIGIQIAEAFVHGGRTLEIREQQCHLSDPETLGLVNTFRSEKAPESLPGQQHPARHVRFKLQRRLDRLARTSGGQFIRSNEPRMLPEFSTSMTMGPGGTAESEGENRCPSYFIDRCVGAVHWVADDW